MEDWVVSGCGILLCTNLGSRKMPRPRRADEAGAIYHVLNRGNARQTIFHKSGDYAAFERVVTEGLEKHEVDLLAYQWMPNHWHMVLSPNVAEGMSAFIYWLTMTHSQRYHAHYQTVGEGHVYQGRYKSFPVQNDSHFHTVCRYVERNAVTAGLVERAEDWQWGSLWNWRGGPSTIRLSAWPIPRSVNWEEEVNLPITVKECEAVRLSMQRSRPLGDEEWTASTANRLGLQSTLKQLGRPRKFTHTTK